ncbi:MAG: hypothetical protein ACP5KB_00870 [Thermoprotei archaeon]
MSKSLTLLVLVLTSLALILLLHVSRRLRALTSTFLALYTIFMISFLLHAPFTQTPLGLTGLKYSDIVHGVFSVRFSSDLVANKEKLLEYWLRPESFEGLVSKSNLCPAPYLDYKLEYPPLIGFFWFLTTCASFSVADKLATATNQFFSVSSSINYVLQSMILFSFMSLCFYYVKKIASLRGLDTWRTAVFLLLPSTVLYATYNWDLIASGLAVSSLYYFMRKNYKVSGLLLGLSVAGKILTGGLLVPLIAYLLREAIKSKQAKKYLILFITTFLVGGLTPFVLMYALSVEGFYAFVNHHASWYCENCVYALLIPDIFSPLHKYFYVFSGAIMLALIAVQVLRNSGDLLSLAYASVSSAIALNYVFTPQMILMISPLAILALSKKELKAYVAADITNFCLIIAFFEDLTLRSLVSRIVPIKVVFNPWTVDSPTQWLAMSRNVLILSTIIASITHHVSKKNQHNKNFEAAMTVRNRLSSRI